MISAEHGLNHRVVTRAPEPRSFAVVLFVLVLLLGPFLAYVCPQLMAQLMA